MTEWLSTHIQLIVTFKWGLPESLMMILGAAKWTEDNFLAIAPERKNGGVWYWYGVQEQTKRWVAREMDTCMNGKILTQILATRRKSLKGPVCLFSVQDTVYSGVMREKMKAFTGAKYRINYFPLEITSLNCTFQNTILLWYLLIFNQSFFAFMNFLPR